MFFSIFDGFHHIIDFQMQSEDICGIYFVYFVDSFFVVYTVCDKFSASHSYSFQLRRPFDNIDINLQSF